MIPRLISAFGETKSISEWARDHRATVDYWTLWYRIIKGKWSPEIALTSQGNAEQRQTDFLSVRTKRQGNWRRFYAKYGDTRRKANNEFMKRRYRQLKASEPEVFQEARNRNKKFRMSTNQRLKKEMIEAYGGICICCGETIADFLTLDHINSDGFKHRKLFSGSYGTYRDLKTRGWPKEGYRLLCMNCNWVRRYKKPCPHEIKRGEYLRVAN